MLAGPPAISTGSRSTPAARRASCPRAGQVRAIEPPDGRSSIMNFTFKLSRRLTRLRGTAASLLVLAMGAVACNTEVTSRPESVEAPSASIASNTPIGSRVRTTGKTNILDTPSSSGTILGTQPKGALGTLVAGPVTDIGGDNHVRWQVDFD